MVRSLYVVYLAAAIGAGAIALSIYGGHQAVTQTAIDCARTTGPERNRCDAQARAIAAANAALAKQILPELTYEIESALSLGR